MLPRWLHVAANDSPSFAFAALVRAMIFVNLKSSCWIRVSITGSVTCRSVVILGDGPLVLVFRLESLHGFLCACFVDTV